MRNMQMLAASSPASIRGCRLLYIVGQLRLGGLERQLYYLLRGLHGSRYNPALAVWNFSLDEIYVQEIQQIGVPIYYFPMEASRAAKLSYLRRLSRQLHPEVIHSYTFFVNFAAYWAALGTNAVAVGSVRSNFIHDKIDSGPWLGRLNARWPRDQIFNSYSAAATARSARKIFSPKRTYVIRNGLDLHHFRNMNGNAARQPYIAAVGTLIPLKRWDALLRIVYQVRRKGGECRVRIAGDGPERATLEKQAQEIGIMQSVEFLGAIPDIPGLLEQSKFLVHTSECEGCPNVVIEAMACGRPVIATDAGDTPFLVEDGKTGFVVRRGDEATFAERVLQLLSDEELCCRMGQAARAKAELEFGLERLVSETLHAYKTAGWTDDLYT